MKSRLEFADLLKSRGLVHSGVEIGVLFGDYSTYILANWPGILYMVDPWVQQPADTYLDGCNAVNMEKALEKTKAAIAEFAPRGQIVRMFSEGAANKFFPEALDFAYIDSNHKKEAVVADIAAWWPKIHSGGILAGHDYYERHDAWQECGVQSAVDEFAAAHGLTLNLTTADSPNSWWFVKP